MLLVNRMHGLSLSNRVAANEVAHASPARSMKARPYVYIITAELVNQHAELQLCYDAAKLGTSATKGL